MYKIHLLLLLLSLQIQPAYSQDLSENIAHFIKDNPGKSSIYLVRNDTVLADINSDRIMPLASTVKILIAIEYAQQVAKGMINPQEMIDSSELDHYYIPMTDGGAHPNWLKSMQQKQLIQGGKIPLAEVAKGMIKFSSNANTEYLIERLGLDNINSNIQKLGLTKQQPLYPFVSALMVYSKKDKREAEELSMEQYVAAAKEMHERMKNDPTVSKQVKFFPLETQKVWSDRLPGATTKEYVSIMKKINSRNYFDTCTQRNLDGVMETLLENPVNRTYLKHAGMKGGSTLFVLTIAMYATTTDGDKTELAYFFNDLEVNEGPKLQKDMNVFNLKIIKDAEQRKKLIEILNK